MPNLLPRKNLLFCRKVVSAFLVVTFGLLTIASPSGAQLLPNLPAPGQMVWLTSGFQPPVLRGMTVHPENPLLFDFIVDRGQDKINNDLLKGESTKLIKYFLTSMTIPDKDAWVNLSPYESDRIIPDALGQTEMGRQMLEQDYVLKQLSASLTNPDKELGQKFWNEVKTRAKKQFGTTDVPLNTFNKVWIVPQGATVVEKDGFAYITESNLKVMLDEDYAALEKNTSTQPQDTKNQISKLSSEVFREMILPKLVEEVNTGKNFAQTRQVYQSVILAAWYKKALKDSLLGKIYVDKSKIDGVESDVKDIKQKVYNQYLEAFKKGVYNIIKEENSSLGEDAIPRKYFSGGYLMRVNPKIDNSVRGVESAASAVANDSNLQIVRAAGTEISKKAIVESGSASSAVSMPSNKDQAKSYLGGVRYGERVNINEFSKEYELDLTQAEEMLKTNSFVQIGKTPEWEKVVPMANSASSAVSMPSNLELAKSYLGGVRYGERVNINEFSKRYELDLPQAEEMLKTNSFVEIGKTPEWEKRFPTGISASSSISIDDLKEVIRSQSLVAFDGAQQSLQFAIGRLALLEQITDENYMYQWRSNPPPQQILNPHDGIIYYVHWNYKSDRVFLDEFNKTAQHLITSWESDTQPGLIYWGWQKDNLTAASDEFREWLFEQLTNTSIQLLRLELLRYGGLVNLSDYGELTNVNGSGRRTTLEEIKEQKKFVILDGDTGNPISLDELPKVEPKDDHMFYEIKFQVRTNGTKVYVLDRTFSSDRKGKSLAQLKDLLTTEFETQAITSIRIINAVDLKHNEPEQLATLIVNYLKGKYPDHDKRFFGYSIANGSGLFLLQFRTQSPDLEGAKQALKEEEGSARRIGVGMFYFMRSYQLSYPEAEAILQGEGFRHMQNNKYVWEYVSSSSLVATKGTKTEVGSDQYGGIDFDPSKLNLQIKRDGHGVPLPLPQQNLENININGLYPVIINIMPINAQTLPILSQVNVQPDVAFSKS